MSKNHHHDEDYKKAHQGNRCTKSEEGIEILHRDGSINKGQSCVRRKPFFIFDRLIFIFAFYLGDIFFIDVKAVDSCKLENKSVLIFMIQRLFCQLLSPASVNMNEIVEAAVGIRH